jgi:hypothetical protein
MDGAGEALLAMAWLFTFALLGWVYDSEALWIWLIAIALLSSAMWRDSKIGRPR